MATLTSERVTLDRLRPNPWNPNRMNAEMYHKELASIRKFGYINPIICYQDDTRDGLTIIDGEHRWKALKELGWGEVDVTQLHDITTEEAKQLTIVLNETRGKPDPKKLGELLADLLQDIPKPDLLDVMPFTPSEFDKLTGLEQFDWEGLSKPLKDESSPWVERTYRLPRDAALVLDEAIEAALDGDEGIPDWQGLEHIAAEFLASSRPSVDASTSATPRPVRTGPA